MSRLGSFIFVALSFLSMARTQTAHSADILFCTQGSACAPLRELCSPRPGEEMNEVQRVLIAPLCEPPVYEAFVQVESLLRRSLRVEFLDGAHLRSANPNSAQAAAIFNRVQVGYGAAATSKADFYYGIFHELGHRVLAEALKACPAGTGELGLSGAEAFHFLQGKSCHETLRILDGMTSEECAMDEGFGDFFGSYWVAKIRERQALKSRYRIEADERRFSAALAIADPNLIKRNEGLVAAWLLREAAEEGGLNRIISALCPRGITLDTLMANLRYPTRPKDKSEHGELPF